MYHAGNSLEHTPYMRLFKFYLVLLLSPMLHTPAAAHAPGEHYLWIGVDDKAIEGEAEIGAHDLKNLLGYDLDLSAGITEDVLRPFASELREYFLQRFSINDDSGELDIDVRSVSAKSFAEGEYAVIDFTASAGGRDLSRSITVRDELLYDQKASHRGLLLITYNERTGAKYREHVALVFSGHNSEQTLNLDDPPGLLTLRQFVWQGMLHIWKGLDHVLFLLTLLLTSVLIYRDGQRLPSESFAQAGWRVFKIVTLFTLAHSITLFLAGLDYITLPSRWVESMIALSIIVVALGNFSPRFDAKKYWIVLGFGLFHGLGFASVMSELPFRMQDLLRVVLYFNVGVELGQIVIVLIAFPVLFWLRTTPMYTPVILKGGSVLLAAIAGVWLVQRLLGAG